MSYSSFARVYDMLTKNVEYARRAEYYSSLLSENGVNGGLLLDLACGTGGLSFELAKKGFSVIGVDLSEEMLSVAQNKKYELGEQNVMFLCQDMRSLDLYGTVDCCVCALDSLNHLTDEADLKKAFRNVALFLENEGMFVFDVNTVFKHRNILSGKTFVYDCPGAYCVWQNSEVTDNNTVGISLDIFSQTPDGAYERSVEEFAERAYEEELIKRLLKECDFEDIRCYDELSRTPPMETSQRIVFTAKRKNRNE